MRRLPAALLPPYRPRRTQSVSIITNRRKVIGWLLVYEETDGTDGMFTKAVYRFIHIFNPATRSANLQKPIDWWPKRERIMGTKRGQIVTSAYRVGPAPRWSGVEWLYPRLLEEFDRLRKLGVKSEPSLLLQLVKQILNDSIEGYNACSVNDNCNGPTVCPSLTNT
ncbi:Hypothetical protein PHPALM_11908 [Phytophthora palmivora]|uniref:Uncharacterized protein n=1 Tax=Phytophthora palmivora TaxID=4796 RepID=A0A2P4Y1C4_9STRA|nr:Hypothetical protein PHPALM_11908 [Phytophthora palmivora]